MTTERKINAAATIAARITTIHIHAAQARAAINEVKHATFGGFVSAEELAVLNAAFDLMEKIKGRTTLHDAMERHAQYVEAQAEEEQA